METKHTPGPWKIVNNVKDRRLFHIQAKGGMWDLYQIGVVKAPLRDDIDIARANARLIAATPELLEACKYTITQLKNVKGKAFPILPILDAIAKAEGK